MLPKKNRADRKSIERIFKSGQFLNSLHLTFKFIFNNASIPQISFIAPKNIAKNAVDRNFLRRMGYLALKKHLNQFPINILGVFIFKKYQAEIIILEQEIEEILKKIKK